MQRASLACAALVATIAAGMAAGCGGETPSNGLADRLQEVLDEAVASPDTVFPGTALYVRHPRLRTWTGAAGEGNVDPPTPMRPGDTFRAGSIMKPFVAAAVLQLVEEGRLSLDDALPSLLPDGVTARVADAGQITVRMLLNHTSGIPDYVSGVLGTVAADPQHVWTVDEFLDVAAAQTPPHAPGASWSYSNTNYNLLGLVIEETTGRPWREVVRERVIDRLGLEGTTLPEPGGAVIGSGDAHGYYRVGTPIFGAVLGAAELGSFEVLESGLVDVTGVDPSLAGAAGGGALVTTTEDLGRFIEALLGGELFERPATLEELLAFVEASDSAGLVGYGLGVERYRLLDGVEVIGHAGGTAGYSSFVGRLPAHEIDVAMVITSEGDIAPVLIPALEALVAEAP